MIHVDIFGSRVSRDIFRYEGQENYRVDRCISGIPISGIYKKKLNIKPEILDQLNISNFSKKMLDMQLHKNPADLLKKSNARLLIIDLADECISRYSLGDGEDGMIAIREDDEEKFEKMVKGYITEEVQLNKFTLKEIDEESIYHSYKQFAREIVRSQENPEGYEEKNIIVIEAYYTPNEIAAQTLNLHNFDAKYKVSEKNKILEKVYQLLYQCIPDCRIIKFPTFAFASENNIRGSHPLSYCDDMYEYYIQALKVLTGKSKRNSIENLYREQCVKNRLHTRMLNAGAIYRIKPLEQQVSEMKKEIEKLKRENQDLKRKK